MDGQCRESHRGSRGERKPTQNFYRRGLVVRMMNRTTRSARQLARRPRLDHPERGRIQAEADGSAYLFASEIIFMLNPENL